MPDGPEDTRGSEYADRLQRLEGARWKQLLDVQAPYRWNLRRLLAGRVLDVGCGIGRNLPALGAGSVGVDHNADSVAIARQRGFDARTVDEFTSSDDAAPDRFDGLLVAHVLEHMDERTGDELLGQYLPFVRAGGAVVLITPQEAGYKSDASHVRWVDLEVLRRHAGRHGLHESRALSFPFSRATGRAFRYNEFVWCGTKP